MFVIYTPEIQQFLRSIVLTSFPPTLEWDYEVHNSGILYTIEDAILMAEDVQQIRVTEKIYHHSVQVLRLGSDKQPNYLNPVYELIASAKIN